MQLRFRPAIKDRIQPIVLFQSFRRLVLIEAERDFTDHNSPFDLDESNVGESLRIMRMGLSGNQIEATSVAVDALNLQAATDLVLLGLFDCDSFDLLVANHERDSRCVTFGMRQNPSTSKVMDVSDGALLLISQLGSAVLKPIVQLV